ncbi:MAG: hypothetical protein ABIT37_09215 [Luteolibacter sp.]
MKTSFKAAASVVSALVLSNCGAPPAANNSVAGATSGRTHQGAVLGAAGGMSGKAREEELRNRY